MRIVVLGAGAWGTALACAIADRHETLLWARDPAQADAMRLDGSNQRYLSGVALPVRLRIEADMDAAIAHARDGLLVLATPMAALRDLLLRLPRDMPALWLCKGFEAGSGALGHEIAQQVRGVAPCGILSGPSFAIEVARDIPTAVVAASADALAAAEVQRIFAHPSFRVYTSDDRLGVELGGALKNVIAIAAGAGDGLGFGDNSKAALVTRSIVEMRRLGEACGAQGETFTGLSGLGDLMVTCFSRLSRNRQFGERVGRGGRPVEIARETRAVAEGYPTARSAFQLARKHGVLTPVIDEVRAMLYEDKDVGQSVRDLMSRDLKPE